jgi:hypothetical protein
MKRAANLQRMLDQFAKEFDIPESVVQGADHPYSCRCDTCFEYWVNIGPDPDTERYGPFTREEVEFRLNPSSPRASESSKEDQNDRNRTD